MNISPNHVDVWCVFLDDGNAPWPYDSYRALLAPDEAARWARLQTDRTRQQYLVTRALARDVLARYSGVPPSELVFTRNAHGKPALAHPAGCPTTFNLSDTKGLSVCAVASACAIGVDVERLARTMAHAEIATRFFSPAEAAYLATFYGERGRQEFLRLWTLKEAFVKARGMGLSIPLKTFSILPQSDQPPRVSFAGHGHGQPSDWQFLQIRLRHSFQIAVAVSMPETSVVTVRLSTLIPLRQTGPSLELAPNPTNQWTLDPT